jgi:DinB family protein
MFARKTGSVGAVPDAPRTHEHCDECGFDGSRYDGPALLTAISDLGPQWRALLATAGERLRVRPAPETWSALEYAAHSRDITALHLFGVEQALTGDEPVVPAIDADSLVEASAATYLDENPDAVVARLDREARRLETSATDAGVANWNLAITIGDERNTVRRLLEHALHDSMHHLDDVERGLHALRS